MAVALPASARAAEVFDTPWPIRQPCAHPADLSLDQWVKDDVVWASNDASVSLTFSPQPPDKSVRLARTFPTDRLRRLTVAALPEQLRYGWLLHLGCGDESSVDWGPCAAGRCDVTASYRVPRAPMAVRVDRWTKPMPYPGFDPDEVPDLRYSLFFKHIGYRKLGDPEIERQSLRLTRDLVADLRDFLRVACRRSACSALVLGVARVADAYLADRAPRYTSVEHHKAYDHWNRGWNWQVAAGGATVKAGCDHMQESHWAWCWLDVDGGTDLHLRYRARTRGSYESNDVEIGERADEAIKKPLGKIWFNDTGFDTARGKTWLEIGGRALATQ